MSFHNDMICLLEYFQMKGYQEKKQLINSPLLLTFQLQQNRMTSMAMSFKNTLRTKTSINRKRSERKASIGNFITQSTRNKKNQFKPTKQQQINREQEPESLKNKLALNFINTLSESTKKSNSIIIFKSYIPKIKCKTTRRFQTQYVSSLEKQIFNKKQLPKKLSMIFIGAQKNQQKEIYDVTKSSNVLIRTSQGKKKKIDSFMYFRKIRSKVLEQSSTYQQVKGKSIINPLPTEKRTLFLKKDIINQKNGYYFTHKAQSSKKRSHTVKSQIHKQYKNDCRPWSPYRSEFGN